MSFAQPSYVDNRDNLDDDPMLLDQQSSDEDDNVLESTDTAVLEEDPLLLAMDDLEGRVVTALDDLKMHSGVRTSPATSVHDELAALLRPVLEVAAHTSPSIARTYYRQGDMEASVEMVYERVVSDLVLPVVLEICQSDTSPAKRCASLEFFRHLWKECQKAGSWLDASSGLQAGPYGPGGSAHGSVQTPAQHAVWKRRQVKRLAREGEILRYWVQASIASTLPGVFTNDEAEGTVASRGIIAASASLRPSLRHIATRIKDADDRGANRLYGPAMKMVEGVLKKLFLSSPSEAMLSSCAKFLEILILCCSRKPQDASARRKSPSTMEDFSLEDLPTGHPVITQEALESISEYAFTALRGLTLLGGQAKMDVNILSDMMLSGDGSPSAQVVSILKPAALAYLEIEATLPAEENALDYELDRTNVDFDFVLAQKSYALVINAMAALAVNRPVYFKESAVCLARRAVEPPVEGDSLSRPAVLALAVQLKGSCLMLLRNSLAISTNTSGLLSIALKALDMELQAEKALAMAQQAFDLKTAGRAARNRANMYYEWDASESDRLSKRDEELAKMRAAKAARGLGHGIQLPTSMAEAMDLILANLTHLPKKRPSTSTKDTTRQVPISLDFVVDAVLTNGASLLTEEGRWYDRDGGTAWTLDLEHKPSYVLSSKLRENIDGDDKDNGNESSKRRKLFQEQSQAAASDAFGRVLASASKSRSKALANLGNQITSRLAFTLGKVIPASSQKNSLRLVKESIGALGELLENMQTTDSLERFVDSYPLAAAGLALEGTVSTSESATPELDCSAPGRIIDEALLLSSTLELRKDALELYDRSVDVFVASTVMASKHANEKPNDNDRKRAASKSASLLQKEMSRIPRIPKSALLLVCAMCDIDDITKKSSEASRRTSHDSIASSAAAHAAKVAAEKRATSALLIIRDAAFQRDRPDTREAAVECAVALACGRLPSIPSIQDKALKLTMNVLYARNETLAKIVVDSATKELKHFSDLAVDSFDSLQKANEGSEKSEEQKSNPLVPQSEEEKVMVEKMRKPVVLFMALCVRQPEIIETLFRLSSVDKASVLSKALRLNMPKLSRAVAVKHGTTDIALRVAAMCTPSETPLLFSFLENLAPSAEKNTAAYDIVEACFKIQEAKADENGNKDPRFIIPVVAMMKRRDLVQRLPEFVSADDKIFLAALVRMGDRQQRQALLFRDEPDAENPTLYGMTLCEQLVYLHKLDFTASGLPQKRYLAAIKLCLEEDEVYNDRVVMSSLDYMSGQFVTGSDLLPLGFMRSVILTSTKHESLHAWICQVLLPRLVEGKIYLEAKQWEGWMRCAHMLEKSEDTSVNSLEAISKLPPEQLMQYKTKWAGK